MDLVPFGCFSARTKAVRRTKLIFHFRRWKKSRALAINCASVLGFRAIDGGHATVLKVFSFLGLSPINRKCSVFPPRAAKRFGLLHISPVKCLLLLQDDPSLVNIKMDD